MNSPTTTIKPGDKFTLQDIKDILSYKDLLMILTWRDIRVRYKQTFIGVAWAILQPLVTMIIFSIFFGRLAKIPSGALPYTLFVLSGLVFWNFFSNAMSHASNSLVEHEHIIKKVYFPRLIMPLSSVITSAVDFSINFVLLLIISFALGFVPHPSIILIAPLLVLITMVSAFGVALFLSALNVKYRDVRYALPFFFQVMIFITPVIYPLNIVSPRNRLIMALNPMTSVIELIRSIIAGTPSIDPNLLLISLSAMTLYTIVGFWYFRKTERFFADIA